MAVARELRVALRGAFHRRGVIEAVGFIAHVIPEQYWVFHFSLQGLDLEAPQSPIAENGGDKITNTGERDKSLVAACLTGTLFIARC